MKAVDLGFLCSSHMIFDRASDSIREGLRRDYEERHRTREEAWRAQQAQWEEERRQEEAQRAQWEEELRRAEEEDRRQQEELRKQEEDRRQRQEEARQQERRRWQEEELRRAEEELRRQQEELRKQEEDRRQRQEEARQQERRRWQEEDAWWNNFFNNISGNRSENIRVYNDLHNNFGKYKNLYRQGSIRWHPDKNDGSQVAADRFKNIQRLYDIIKLAHELSQDQFLSHKDIRGYNNHNLSGLVSEFERLVGSDS